jgi:subtilisin-like proprotein convertase family protein
MKKALLLTLFFALIVGFGYAQTDRFWSANSDIRSSITTDKGVARLSFPKVFKLFNLNIETLRQELFSIVGSQARKQKTVISLPNADGNYEQFEVNEASNFEPDLQARFPEIRAYSGKGITDRYATLKLSISPQGIQTMIFRTDKQNEFIEPYSKDHAVYAVFPSQRDKGKLSWSCSTEDKQMVSDISTKIGGSGFTGSNAGELKTMRLAQSCNGEYANYFLATSAAQVALVLAAYNATLTRCNGVYEKDLALHLNLVPETVNVIYYDPATDPYTTLANWNTQLQIALNTTLTGPATPINVNNAAYDIGHMFGASGGGGNAGCIGCVCVDGIPAGTGATKGRGITSPADNIPQGDNFDIDYVAHEVGHQLGGNHTFSFSNEGTGVNKEVGAGITVMGYAGITAYDPAPHSIDIFHEASIGQIQTNLATKTCPITVAMTLNHAPVIAALSNYTIPISTPFALTGSATDQENDPLTYCWEQSDDGAGQTAANSVASPGKLTGPNWLTFPATATGTRLFPKLSTVQAGLMITPPLPGGDAICNIEALSSVSRVLNFKLTVRDNHAYVAGQTIGQTNVATSIVTVTNTAGPFQVTVPNTNVSWGGGSSQTVTWDVNNTTAAPVSVANVKISLSTDGGVTFPTVLLASTPNDGTQAVTLPNTASTTARIKVEAVGNVFYDMSNVNFTITSGAPTAPTVTINQAAAQADPTSVSPINFTAVFDQDVIGFTATGVTLSGTAGAVNKAVTGGPSTFNIAVSGMTSSGTVIATIPAGVCTNAAAQANLASTSTDNTVTYNLVTNNDVCSGAITINCGQTLTGTTVGMTLDAVGTCVTALNTAPGVWYTFIGDGSSVTLSLCGSGYDTKIGVFSGTCAALVCVTGNDDFCGLQSQVTFNSVNGTTYYVLVTGFGTATGAFTLARTCVAPIVNDNCTGAITISCNQTITGTTVGAGIDNVATCVTTLNTAGGIWYKFVGNGVQNILSLCGSGYDTKIGVFSGTCAALVCVTGNDDFCGLQSQVTFTPVLGTTYYVLITGFGAATGAFTLNRTCTGIANDVCFEALPIACGQTVTGTTVGSVVDVVPTCVTALNTAGGVWYKFTGNGFATTLSLCNATTTYDSKIGVFSGTCAALVCVTGNDDFCGLQSQVTFTSVNGTDYYVLVTGFGAATGAFSLAMTCALPPCLPSTITPAAPAAVCAGTIVQLVASSANAGNPPHVWAPVTDLYTNALATIAYTGTAVNTVYVKTTITRTYTATLQSVTCNATPASVTVNVNPNPAIVIIADPGTTICEGDPTLLTVVTGSVTASGVLYSQTGVSTNGSPSQVFEPANTAFNSQTADDFTVPAGVSWTITQLSVDGTGTGTPTSVNVFFYNNSGTNLPGTAVASMLNIATFVRTGGNYVVTLPSSVVLPTGTYWVSFQVNMPFTGQGQWFWSNYGATNVGNQYAFQNPGGGFATPCTTWGYGATSCNVGGGVNRNSIFSVTGTSQAGSGPLGPGYTFLWTPAAGLSSTTSNPVAASPMNTTTYTVTATTPGGCSRQASILITVNKRPTVTTQPVANVRCAGTTATFTVGATGTGLNYQWQVNTAGCTGGTWANLANGTPYLGVNTATLNISPVTGLMTGYGYRCIVTGVCAPIGTTNISNCATLTVNPLPIVTITPPISCGGVAGINGTLLSTASTPPPVPGSVTVNSGTISVPVPDNNPAGATHTLAVSTVPANATITNIHVKWTMPHTWVGDMVFALKAPNGQILNLDYLISITGAGPSSGFVNTTVSSAGVNALSTGTDPYTGTFRADAVITNVNAGAGGPTGFTPTATTWAPLYAPANGNWVLAMKDAFGGDVGTLTNWMITFDYTTPGTTGSTLSYVWSPLAGLYTNSIATTAYTGTNLSQVYAAPTTFTTYTATATDIVTGCVNTATAYVNYTPPAPNVTPSSVAMCLGDASVRLVSSSSTNTSLQFCSGPISVVVPDNNPAGATSNITVSGVPAACNVSAMAVTFNMNHTWDGDVVVALKAPNGQILNLDYYLSGTGGTGATTGFVNTKISSTGSATLGSGSGTYTGTFRADGVITAAFGGAGGPTGFTPTTTTWAPLYTNPNGVWTLAMKDGFAGDQGTLTSWCIDLTYTCGVPSTAAVWSPAGGLFTDPSALPAFAYVAGTPRDTVWTRPTPAGVYTYNVTVQSVPVNFPTPATFTNPANIVINNVGTATPSPANLVVSGLATSGVTVRSVNITGFSHTWAGDVNMVLQHPNGTTNVILMANSNADPQIPVTNVNLTFSDAASASIPTTAIPSGTYLPTNRNGGTFAFLAPGPTVTGPTFPASPTLSTFTGNMNGTWKLFVEDRVAGDAGNIAGGFSIDFNNPVPPCTSPARIVVVTVNTPTSVTTQPVNQTVCTDKVATFTVVAGGSGPFSYQWQESTNSGNTFTNINNGGVYSGATSATLTITAPPVSMSNNFYRVVITGAAPCASATSFQARLLVNPLPVIVISANPYTSLFPGLQTTLSSTVSPSVASTYSWLRDGAVLTSPATGVVSGVGTGSLLLNVDGMGTYQLRVTDVNGCTNTSNSIIIKDSASAKCFMYPNPTSGQFEIRFYSLPTNVLPRTLTIYNMQGERVYTKLFGVNGVYDRMAVDMRNQSKGVYTVEVGDRNGNRITICKKLVIQ